MSDFAPTATKRRSALLRWLIVFFIAFDVAFLWQRQTGVHTSEFGAHPDEGAHVVTGLFVRDALAVLPACIAQRSREPLAPFAGKDAPGGFYTHYPKVALGVWPPFFYMVQSAWTFLFGTTRFSVLLLMAALAAITATVLFRFLQREFGAWLAGIGALLWLSAPLVRELYGMAMAETLSALTMFGAALSWGLYLDSGKKQSAVVFSLLAAAAILTKGSGLALALMVLFSILIARRWHVLRRRDTWLAALLVVIIAGPWTYVFRNAGTEVGGWADNSGGLSLNFIQAAVPYYFGKLAMAAGFAVAGFAVIGLVLRGFGRGEYSGSWAAMGGLVLGVLAFQSVIPVGLEARHLTPATPALVALAVAGAVALARYSAESLRARHRVMWGLLLALLFIPQAFRDVEKKAVYGMAPIATELLATAPAGSRILISSDASGEGMFIAEIALGDRRPNLRIDRASVALVSAKGRTWDGRRLRNRYDDDEALLKALLESPLSYVVLDDAVPESKRVAYHDQIRDVIRNNIGIFWPIAESPITRDGEPRHPPVTLYRIVRR